MPRHACSTEGIRSKFAPLVVPSNCTSSTGTDTNAQLSAPKLCLRSCMREETGEATCTLPLGYVSTCGMPRETRDLDDSLQIARLVTHRPRGTANSKSLPDPIVILVWVLLVISSDPFECGALQNQKLSSNLSINIFPSNPKITSRNRCCTRV